MRMLQEEVERKEQELIFERERMSRKAMKRSKKVRETQEMGELGEQLAHERKIQKHLQRQVGQNSSSY